ncbi:MAG: SurA N-terminal domain-containing protein [Gammaproteobacteria bacterium]
MLQNIREKLTGWVAVAVLLIIGVPLALTFVSSDFTVTGTGFAARVNGEDIPAVDFQRVYQNRLVEQQQAARGEVTPEVQEQLKRQALDNLVLNRAVSQYVRNTGFRVSNGRVIDYIRGLPVFQVGGQFSKPAYDATLAAQAISPTAYEQEQQSMLAVRQLQEGLAESSFFTPAEFRRLIELDQERRDVAYVLLDPRALAAAGIAASDQDIQAYYAANQGQFQAPESANLEYVEVSLADMARNYAPDDEALRKAYDADPTRFRSAEERRARHILIAVDATRTEVVAKALADEIEGKLAGGADFAALAAQYSSDTGSASRGGDLGFAARGNYVPAFDKALFDLKPGEISPPVKTEFGYHIIRLDELRPGTERSFDEVRTQLEEELRKQKAQDEFYAIAERLDDLALENPTSLEPVARDTGLTVKKYAGFTREGGGPFGANANLISAVFAPGVLDGGENTPLIELDDTRAVVVRVSEYKLPAARPLVSVRDEVAARIVALRATTEANTRGEALLKRVESGQDLTTAAAESRLTVIQAGPVTRRAPTVSPELLAAIFRAPKPDTKPVVRGLALGAGGYAVFELKAVYPGEPERVPVDQREQRRQALAQRAAVAETDALAAELRDSAKVVVAPNLFKSTDAETP